MQMHEQTRNLRMANLTKDLTSLDEHCRTNAFRDILSFANEGDGEAMFQVARCLNKGIGVECDTARADHWLRLACVAKPASTNALFTYGLQHVTKRRPDADVNMGIEYLERCASKGHVAAILELVKIIETGMVDIRPDLHRAYRLLANSILSKPDLRLRHAYLSFVERNPIQHLLDS